MQAARPLQQTLFTPPARKTPPRRRRVPVPAPLPRRTPLWLAVYLPRLPLHAVLNGTAGRQPSAVIETDGRTSRIQIADETAERAGIVAGMSLSSAWARLPELAVHQRDTARERRLLYRLATWGLRFTPSVCLDEQALLLEVRASLRLFGGIAELRRSVDHGLRRFHLSFGMAMAPTPRAALWLARSKRDVHVDHVEVLSAALGELPLSSTGFDAELLERLRGTGARYLRDVLRLPRDGFARRYGARPLREIDQALGRVADVRRPVPPPKRFEARFDLAHEVEAVERLHHPLQQLLDELDDWLRATQQGVHGIRVDFVHRDESVTGVQLGFAEVTRNRSRMLALLERKLENVRLAASVLEIRLQAHRPVPLAGHDRALFREQRDDENWPQLLECLRARLGDDAVTGIEPCADHRPECAWQFVAPGRAGATIPHARRPHWLLETPQPLSVVRDMPWCDGPLVLLDGPERIETGWWDGNDVVRDYFIARDAHGRRLWLCRDARTGRWWLQGVFG